MMANEYIFGPIVAGYIIAGWIWLWRELHPKPIKPRPLIVLTKHGDTWR